jgi:hypothetical protein
MIVADLCELAIVGVFDRGIPNRERIVIVPQQQVNLGQYGLMLGLRASGNTAVPIRDNLLWFGDGFVDTSDMLFIYTGPGEPRATAIPNGRGRIISVHWGRGTVLFGDPNFVPILFRIDAVTIPAAEPAIALTPPPSR